MNAEVLPEDMRGERAFVNYLLKQRDDGRTDKVPAIAGEQPSGLASTTDPDTWSFIDRAQAGLRWASGIGFVFAGGYVGVDLDDCIDNGTLHSAAQDLVTRLDGYAELSPSGNGVHVIVRGSLDGWPRNRTKQTPWGGGLEVYEHGRFFTLTGNTITGGTQ